MSTSTDARSEILQRIRTALPGAPTGIAASYAQVSRGYEQQGTLDREACLELLIDRLLDYDTEVIQLEHAGLIPATVEDVLKRHGEPSVLVAEAFPDAWLPVCARVVVDRALGVPELESHPAVLTTCEVAIASTGTLILVHQGAQGRRALTLLPDRHICLVRRDQVVERVPEAFAKVAPLAHLPITTISGPSATSDIEMTRIKGVHGPRHLTVILYN